MKLFAPVQLPAFIEHARSLEEPLWLLENLIPYEGMALISGRAKLSKKTWLAYLETMAVAAGVNADFIRVTGGPQPVAYFNQEGPIKATAQRFEALARGHGIPWESLKRLWFMHRTGLKLDNKVHAEEIRAFLRLEGIKLAVFDTLAKSMQGDENSATDMGKVVNELETIRSMGIATLVIHHLRKNDTASANGEPDPDQDLRGSSALAGAYDSHMALRQYGHGRKALDLVVQHKIAGSSAYRVKWDFTQTDDRLLVATMSSKGADPEDLTKLSEEDLRALVNELEPETEYRNDQLAGAWEVDQKTAGVYAAQCAKRGFLVIRKYGAYSVG